MRRARWSKRRTDSPDSRTDSPDIPPTRDRATTETPRGAT
jgi:hypothetical protein